MLRRWPRLATVALVLTSFAIGSNVPVSLAAGAPPSPAGSISSDFGAMGARCAFVASVAIRLADGTTRGFDETREALTDKPVVSASDCVGDGQDLAATPSATGPIAFGTKIFLPSSPFYSRSDQNSTFCAQVTYSSNLPVAFGFQVSPALRAIASGPVTKAYAWRTPGNCTYDKRGVSVSYFFHWSCPTHSDGVEYNDWGNWAFPVKVSGATGTATINWQFNYVIYWRVT